VFHRETRSPSGRLSAKGGRLEDPTKIRESRVNSVRVPVRFIELEQQAAIKHNSIISFFRTFLPSSPCYDGARRPRDTQAPHVYQSATAEDSPPYFPRREESVSLFLSSSPSYSSSWRNREFQIPNPKHLPSGARLHASGIFFGTLRLEGSLLKTLQLAGCRRCRTKTGITILKALVRSKSPCIYV